MITNQQRNEAYEMASAEQKTQYAAPESGAALWAIAENHGLTADETYTKFVITVGDVILNLLPATQLSVTLAKTLGLEQDKAAKVTTEVLGFLVPLPTKPAGATTAEKAQESVPGMRTMASDMNGKVQDNIPTYTSTQEAILKEGRPAQDNSEARWGQ